MKKKATGKVWLSAVLAFVVFTIVTGFLYTLVVTGIGQLIFPHQANGSVIEIDGKTYGSELLGQQFTDEGYLWGRIMNINTQQFVDEDGNPVMYSWAWLPSAWKP